MNPPLESGTSDVHIGLDDWLRISLAIGKRDPRWVRVESTLTNLFSSGIRLLGINWSDDFPAAQLTPWWDDEVFALELPPAVAQCACVGSNGRRIQGLVGIGSAVAIRLSEGDPDFVVAIEGLFEGFWGLQPDRRVYCSRPTEFWPLCAGQFCVAEIFDADPNDSPNYGLRAYVLRTCRSNHRLALADVACAPTKPLGFAGRTNRLLS